MYSFGRLVPKEWKHVEKWPYQLLGIPTVEVIEKTLHVPPLVRFYDQKEYNACVGFSSSWMMSIYNTLWKENRPPIRYNALWLYHRAQIRDNDPYTSPEHDVGTYVWAAMEALRLDGHVRMVNGKNDVPDLDDGISSYYWCRTVDEIRTAISTGRPVVFGISWYEEFMTPVKKGVEHWIGTQNLGHVLGGHAICCYAASDRRQAFKLRNSWGSAYPSVWIPYEIVRRLIPEDSEFCAAIDNPKST